MNNHRLLPLAAALLAAAIAVPASAQVGGVTATGVAPGVAAGYRTISATATVSAIDMATRQVTLRRADGSTFTIVAGPDVRNLGQVRVGDTVKLDYYDTLIIELIKGGTGAPASVVARTDATRSELGQRPGGTALRETKIVANVIGVDSANQRVTVRGAQGNVVTLPVKDRAQFNLISVGDQIELTYAEAVAVAVTPVAATAMAPTSDQWRFGAMLYAYLPSIGGQTTFPADTSGPSVSVDLDNYFDNLKFAIMGSFEAKKGRWGGFTDLLYVDFGKNESGTRDLVIGGIEIPASASASVNFDLKATMWTLAGEYAFVAYPSTTMDLFAGARMINLKQDINWGLDGAIGGIPTAGRTGDRSTSETNWDAIIGVKGRWYFHGNSWFVPYYADIGAGQSDFTWQLYGGVGYSYKQWDFIAAWRYVDYDLGESRPISEISMNGPQLGIAYRW